MIYNCVSFPSRFAEWCELLLHDMVVATAERQSSARRSRTRSAPEASRPQVALIVGDSLAQIGRQLLLRNCDHAIVVSRQAHSDTCQVLKDAGRPFLVVLDEPASAVNALISDHRLSYLSAVRIVANSSASLLQFVTMANALVLRPDPVPDFEAAARTIERHFHFGHGKAVLDEILSRPQLQQRAALVRSTLAAVLEAPARAPEAAAEPPTSTEIVPEDPFAKHRQASLLEGAIEPLWRALQGDDLKEVVWGRDLFQSGDRPGESAVAPINLTGPSRCLSFGPYLRLPGGPWSCRVIFACNERAVGTQMMADVAYVGIPLGQARFQLSEAGVFEIEFAFNNSTPDKPIEVRLFNMTAALDGHVALGEVRLSPLEFKRLPVVQ
jgi:hypothetical protein